MTGRFALCAVVALAVLPAACASATPAPSPRPAGPVTVALGEATGSPIGVTPLAVVEDSRCPVGAQCVWAGTVRVRARIKGLGKRREIVLSQGEPQQIGAVWLELLGVCPAPIIGRPLRALDYRFTFLVAQARPEQPEGAFEPCPSP